MFTHIPKAGYVGVGTVSGEPRPFEEAVLSVGGEDRCEWIVPVTWEASVPRAEALWRTGFFANQNSACKLRACFTIDEVSRHFGIV
ncbi:hypothetical protein [Streptomyces indicus]|uniref:Uncharacterized protein n=1 Tax=Streptomyces indicus TaxID=417292 RepID=A0A1G9JHH9_9ACTN|nr:hypothetical protein [Streptomyces indicus]SDL36851.1 hypothetical protein SAMN05421806_1316 [Streptomyces indicus]